MHTVEPKGIVGTKMRFVCLELLSVVRLFSNQWAHALRFETLTDPLLIPAHLESNPSTRLISGAGYAAQFPAKMAPPGLRKNHP